MAISVAKTLTFERAAAEHCDRQARHGPVQVIGTRVPRCSDWPSIVVPGLSTLLNAAGYSDDEAQRCMAFTEQHLLKSGALGPPPCNPTQTPVWASYLTDDHTPIEYSIDIGPGATKVRYAFEPLGANSGKDDPWNVQAPKSWLTKIASAVSSVDLDWYGRLASELLVDDDVLRRCGRHVHHDAAAAAQGLTQVLCAVDFNKVGLPLLKTYVLLDAPRRVLGEQEVLRRIDTTAEQMGLGRQWQSLRAYLAAVQSNGSDNGAQLEFVSVDCVHPSKARFKPYVRFARLTRSDFLRHLRLGQSTGQLTDQAAAYQELCAALWDALCDDDQVAVDARAIDQGTTADIQERTHGAIFYYEMHASKKDSIQPKAYLPVRHLLSNDAEVARRIDGILARTGLKPQGWYADLIRQFAVHRSLARGTGVQTMIGVALKNGKPSLSIYLNPEAYSYPL